MEQKLCMKVKLLETAFFFFIHPPWFTFDLLDFNINQDIRVLGFTLSIFTRLRLSLRGQTGNLTLLKFLNKTTAEEDS